MARRMTPLTRILILTLISVSVFFCVVLSWVAGIHRTLLVTPAQLASLSYTTGDQQRYLEYARTGQTIAPYKYRVIALAPVRLLVALGMNPYLAFLFWNAISAIGASLLFAHLLGRFYEATLLEQIAGMVALLTSIGVVRTALFPMLDCAALLASVAVLYVIHDGRLRYFIPIALLAVGTKEVFAMSGLLFALYQRRAYAVIALPIAAFMLIRLALGGAALEVNYGFDLAQGHWPIYGQRLLSLRGWETVLIETLFAGGVLWAGVLAYRERFIRLALLTYVAPMVAAAWILSSRIARPLVVIVPVLALGCILLIRQLEV